ncbi:MAG TPA: JDVT-CTERM system glutamic-type intramembrane protease [Methylibium sp.]|nr:JDVT-CTERM system glutamic-type intramembrane protease [Methylibium sp.]
MDAVALATTLAVAPLLEEIVFRLGLHDALLKRWGPGWRANAAVALAFGVAHALLRSPGLGLGVLLPALVIGGVYERWRRLWPCVLLHAAFNGIWLLAHR